MILEGKRIVVLVGRRLFLCCYVFLLSDRSTSFEAHCKKPEDRKKEIIVQQPKLSFLRRIITNFSWYSVFYRSWYCPQVTGQFMSL